jgi:Family of unknown function (DUF6491)
MNDLIKIGFIGAATLLASCTSTPAKLPTMAKMLADTTGQNGRACIRTSDIRGFAVRKGKVIVINGGRDHFIASVRPGCTDLETSGTAAFGGDSYEICGGRMDVVAAGDSSCTIDKIFVFEDRKAAHAAYDHAYSLREAFDQEE